MINKEEFKFIGNWCKIGFYYGTNNNKDKKKLEKRLKQILMKIEVKNEY